MKRIIFTLFLSIVFLSIYGQTASNLLPVLAVPKDTSASNYLFVVRTPGPDFSRINAAKMDSLKLKPWNLIWLTDTIYSKGDIRYAQLLGAYSNPAFVNSLSAAKVFGLSTVALTGNYSDLSGIPNPASYYPSSNPNGYISGITGPMVNAALGFIPYDGSTNPNNYQTKTVQATDGVLKSSSSLADTLKSDWNLVMSVQRATDSISSIRTLINSKQPYSDTNTYDATRYWVGTRGYLTGITSFQINSALGYTPLAPSDTVNKWYPRNSNPNGYLTTITSGQINSALGYTPLQPSDTTFLSNRINLKLNVSDTTGKWKSVSYTPSSSEITTSLGYTPVPNSRTITINGTAQDLTANRSWTVGDVFTSGSYGNPSWITSLAWSKISGTPTTLSGYGITDGVTNSTLSGYATTSALTSGLSGKVDNTRTLTINGSTFDLSANRTWNVGTLVANDTISLSNRINGKLSPSDTVSLSNRINIKQNQLNGTGFVKASGSTISYDNSTYLTTETDPLFDTKFAGKSTTNLTEGTSLYWTSTRSNNALTSTAINTAIGGTVLKGADTASLSSRINTKVDQAGARSAISLTTTGTSGASTYNSSTGVLNIPNYSTTNPTFNNNPGRALNTSYQPSTTKNVFCTYSVTITTTLSLLNLNSSGVAYLEISPDNSTWTTINSGGITRTLSVSITVGLNDQSNINLQGYAPANWYMRIRTVTSGGASVTMSAGQETTF